VNASPTPREPQASSSAAQAAQTQAAQTQATQSAAGTQPARDVSAVQRLRERRATVRMPGEDLSIAESLRVLDVARELRNRRETAEEMFRHDSVRQQLKEKLLATAKLSGDTVTEAEIDVAIDQYLSNVHTYSPPEKGWRHFLATCWVVRDRIAIVLATAAAAATAWLVLF